MLSLDERIIKSKEKVQQLEHQRRAKEKKEQELKRKADTQRKTIVGEIFIRHFPDIINLTPRRTASDNSIEFSLLDDFFSALADDMSWSELIKSEIACKRLSESQRAKSSSDN